MGLTLDVGSANPGAARKASQDLNKAAGQAAQLGAEIALAVSGTVGQGVWTGAAAEAFAKHMESRVKAANAIAQGLQLGAAVLSTYADELTKAKSEWDKAMAQVQGLPGPLKWAVLGGESLANTATFGLTSVIASAITGQAQDAGAQLMAAEALAVKAAADCALGLNSANTAAQEAESVLGKGPQGVVGNVEDFASGFRGAEVNFALGLVSMGSLLQATENDPRAALPDWEKMGSSIIDNPGAFARNIVNWDQISGEWKSGHPGQAIGDGLFTGGSLIAGLLLGGEGLGADAGTSAAEAGAEDAARTAAEGAAGTAADGGGEGGAQGAGGASREGGAAPGKDPGASPRSPDPGQAQPGQGNGPAPGAVAKRIADGHSYGKHVVEQGEYPKIKNRDQFEQLIQQTIENPTAEKPLSDGRAAYWNESEGTVVIIDPNNPDGGTAFRPTAGYKYYLGLK